MQNDITYILNGHNLAASGIYVSASQGLIDGLQMKKPTIYDWGDQHGHVVDLSAPKYEARTITLECFMEAKDKLSFALAFNNFLKYLSGPGLKRLEVHIVPKKPLVYEVYPADPIEVSKRWSAGHMVGTFKLKFIEPEPVKCVFRFNASDLKGKTNTLYIKELSAPKPINIYWGDNSSSLGFEGEGTKFHNYLEVKDHYVIISGGVDELKGQFKITAEPVWLIPENIHPPYVQMPAPENN